MADLRVQYLRAQTMADSRAEAMELSRAAVEARRAAFLTERHSYHEPESLALPIVAAYLNCMHEEARPAGGALRCPAR